MEKEEIGDTIKNIFKMRRVIKEIAARREASSQ